MFLEHGVLFSLQHRILHFMFEVFTSGEESISICSLKVLLTTAIHVLFKNIHVILEW